MKKTEIKKLKKGMNGNPLKLRVRVFDKQIDKGYFLKFI